VINSFFDTPRGNHAGAIEQIRFNFSAGNTSAVTKMDFRKSTKSRGIVVRYGGRIPERFQKYVRFRNAVSEGGGSVPSGIHGDVFLDVG
jgi:hypothetical protein